MNIKIEKLVMSGSGPRTLWKLTCDGKTMFVNKKSEFGAFNAWTKKKDAQAIVNAIETHGLQYVEEKLGCTAF